jgi:cytoskeletal protein CcmA (bactofilin family)
MNINPLGAVPSLRADGGRVLGKKKEGIATFLGPDVSFEGEMRFEGTVRVDGRFKGILDSKGGMFVVGERALVEGEVTAGRVIVAGKVHGLIRASESVQIQKTGQVVGDIVAPSVTIDSGAVFHGSCSMDGKPGLPQKALPGPPGGGGIELVRQKTSPEGD